MYSTLQWYRISFKLTPTCPLHSIVPRIHPFCLAFKHFINSYSRSLTRDRVPIHPSRALNLIRYIPDPDPDSPPLTSRQKRDSHSSPRIASSKIMNSSSCPSHVNDDRSSIDYLLNKALVS